MPPPLIASLLALLAAGPPAALAHSHLAHIIVNGNLYHGYDARPNQTNHPAHVGWSTTATDDGFVAPANYSHPDIICHRGGASPRAHAPVRPGDRVHVQWNGWPINHVGPVLTYLAPCAGLPGAADGCAGVDKTALRWTKLDDSRPVVRLQPGAGRHGGVPGQLWATDVLIATNHSWQVAVPGGLAPGPYVLRQEIIALHFAAQRGGAQNYPLCMNLWVEGADGGEGQDAGPGLQLDAHDAMEFYKEDEPGVLLNVTAGVWSYAVPGPTVAAGATPIPHAQQSISLSRIEGTPVMVTRSTETVPLEIEPTATTTAARRVRGRYERGGGAV